MRPAFAIGSIVHFGNDAYKVKKYEKKNGSWGIVFEKAGNTRHVLLGQLERLV